APAGSISPWTTARSAAWCSKGIFPQPLSFEEKTMAKIIVFSGHGSWDLGADQYVKVPGKCSIKFYTLNMKTLSDSLGGDIDRGMIAGLEPDQEAGQFGIVPNMRLYPP